MAGISQSSGPVNAATDSNRNYTVPLVILTTLFFMWGFITCLNDILIPFLKDEFSLSNLQANLVQSAFFGAYFIISLLYFLFSVYVFDPIQRIGYKNAIITGLVIAAIGCILFVPASESGSFVFFLFALFVLASGITILQMGANPYVTLLGKPESASSRLNMTQAFNALGTTVAPVVGGLLIFGARSSDAVQGPYVGLTIALIILGVLILFSPLPKIAGGAEESTEKKEQKGKGALAYPHLVLGVICIFAYVGGEVAVGSNLITYLEDVCHMPKESADSFLAIFWGGAMIGRFYGSIFLTGRKFEFSKLTNIAVILAFSFILGVFLVNKSYIVNSVVGQKQEKVVGAHSDSLSIVMDGRVIYNPGTQIPEPKAKEHVADIVSGSFSSFELANTPDGKKQLTLFANPASNQEMKDFQVYANLKNNEVALSAFEKVSFSFDKLTFWEAGIFCLMALINIGAFFLGAFSPGRTLGLFAGIVVLLLAIAVFASGTFAMWSVLSIGLFNSIMFPTIFSLAIKGLGKDTSQGSSLLVMAIVGGGIVPPIQGLVADLVNIQISFLIPIVCYAYILFYGLVGSKPRNVDGQKGDNDLTPSSSPATEPAAAH